MPSYLYGKLPGHGDFISRGLERAREAALDAALTASVDRARQQWGEGFEDRYASAQPWLFLAQEGTAIIIPSADKVGRTFPLYAATQSRVVLQALYDATVNAIAGGQTADELFAAMEEAPMRGDASSEEPEGRWFCIDESAPRLPLCWDDYSMTLGEITA